MKTTTPLLKTKQLIDRVFRKKPSASEASLESISEIEAKADFNTISLKFTRISEVLPLENISIIKQLLKVPLKDETSYIEELKSLSAEVLQTL